MILERTTRRSATRPAWGATLVLVALGWACTSSSPEPETPPEEPEEVEEVVETTDMAGGDLSGADCEIWIAPGGQREVYLWFNTETKPGTTSPTPTQPEDLEIHLWPKNDDWCVGAVELPHMTKRTLKVEFNADRTLKDVTLGGTSVDRTEYDSTLTHQNPTVFAVNLDPSSFVLHVHYAGIELVVTCTKGDCS